MTEKIINQFKFVEDGWKQIVMFLESADKSAYKSALKKDVKFKKFAKTS